MHLGFPVDTDAVSSKAVVLLSLIHCLMQLQLCDSWCSVLSVWCDCVVLMLVLQLSLNSL